MVVPQLTSLKPTLQENMTPSPLPTPNFQTVLEHPDPLDSPWGPLSFNAQSHLATESFSHHEPPIQQQQQTRMQAEHARFAPNLPTSINSNSHDETTIEVANVDFEADLLHHANASSSWTARLDLAASSTSLAPSLPEPASLARTSALVSSSTSPAASQASTAINEISLSNWAEMPTTEDVPLASELRYSSDKLPDTVSLALNHCLLQFEATSVFLFIM
jgi:hypothetical protein